MFNSLSDYLQQQRDREEALKRKLSQLKPTVRNGEAGEIIAALIDLGSDLDPPFPDSFCILS